MHRPIKRFSHQGLIVDDKYFARLKFEYEQIVYEEMEEAGYLPLSDLWPAFSTSLRDDGETYEFVISIYGIYVGKKKACQYQAITQDGRLIPRVTKRAKSEQS